MKKRSFFAGVQQKTSFDCLKYERFLNAAGPGFRRAGVVAVGVTV